MSLIQELQNRKSEITHKQIQDALFRGILTVLVMVAFGAVIAAIGFYMNDGITIHLLVTFPVFVVTTYLIKKLYPYEKRFTPKKIELTFKKWLNYYHKLNQFDPFKKNSVKNMISSTESLAFSVDSWVSDYAPSAVQIISKSIKHTLENNIVDLLKSEDKEKISQFSKYFLGVCHLLSRREPTYNEWIKISKDFIHITTGRSIDSINLELVTDAESPIGSTQNPNELPFATIIKNPLLYVGMAVWFPLFTALVFQDHMGVGMSAVWSTISSATVVGAIPWIQRFKIQKQI